MKIQKRQAEKIHDDNEVHQQTAQEIVQNLNMNTLTISEKDYREVGTDIQVEFKPKSFKHKEG